jgi:putative ABC transport system permease protein
MLRLIWQSRIARDFAFALRLLRRKPAFSLAAILTMSIGIAATTVMVSLVNAVLLRPLPYPDSERLVQIWSAMPGRGIAKSASALPDYQTWQKESRTLESIGAYKSTAFNLSGLDAPKRVRAVEVSPSVLRVLDVRPRIGEWFAENASEWGPHRVVMLSHGFWRSGFGADPQVIGRRVLLDGETYLVVGVMPASFEFPDPVTDVWVPLSSPPDSPLRTRQTYPLSLVGRVRPGVTFAQAQTELTSIVHTVDAQVDAAVVGLRESTVGDVRPTLWLLLGAVAFVLLIACANVANLTLVRNMSRQRELMIRSALGASRGRIVQQVLTESLVIAVIGGLLGIFAAAMSLRTVASLTIIGVPRLSEVTIDVRVLVITLLVSAAAGLISGALPAFTISRVDVTETLKASGRSHTTGRRDAWARALLVAGEVCLAVSLLIGAGLMILTVVRLQLVVLGFRPQQVLTFQLDLPERGYADPQRVADFIDRVVDRLRTTPGTRAVGATSALPLLDTAALSALFSIDGRSVRTIAEVPAVGYRQITPGYFQAMGVTLLRGRSLSDEDRANAPLVAIVNETLSKRFWPNGDALGQTFHLGPPESLIGMKPGTFPRVTIVGVIHDIRHDGQEQPVKPEVFIPFTQAGPMIQRSLRIVAKVDNAVMSHAADMQAVVSHVDHSLAVSDVRAMDDRVRVFLGHRRFTVWLLSAFAAVAFLMAAIGIYGVMAYVASERLPELGIRLALGARNIRVIGLVVAQNLRPTVVGLVAGVLLASILSALIRNQLFDVSPMDPIVYLVTLSLMLVTALLASYLPVRQALASEPMRALKGGGDQ